MNNELIYFSKFLPVDGEVKLGDHFIDTGVMNLIGKRANKEGDYSGYQKVKLFLCSRNIQIGDKVKTTVVLNSNKAWSNDTYANFRGKFQKVVGSDYEFIVTGTTNINGGGFTTEDNIIICKYNSFKVIGEISTDATWVKEGDKFSEDQVRLLKAVNVKYHTRAHAGTDVMNLGYKPVDYYTPNIIQDRLERWHSEPEQYGISSSECDDIVFVHTVEILGQCGHFH